MHAPPGMFDPLGKGDPEHVGGYRLRARLGSGGMGEVFLSFTASGQAVAVKVLRREFADDPQFRARFVHEVRAARLVEGPCIARLLDADPHAPAPWLATAFVPGPTLADAVQLYGPLPVATVIVLMAGIAESLRAIHEAGIVHRDLKPANVILGADGLRVIDFGIARAADATALTLSGMMIGSPHYAAPEQVLGDAALPAGDVFSLGALAHYAATGRPAFGEGPRFGVVYRIVNEEPDLAGCPLQIRALIASCLAKDPEARPSTDEIIESCKPDEPPPGAEAWLPPPVVYAIETYQRNLAELAELAAAAPDGGSRGELADAPEPPAPPKPRPRRGVQLMIGAATGLAIGGACLGVALGLTPPARSSPGTQIGVTADPSTGLAFPPDDRGGGPGGPPPTGPPPTALEWSGDVRFTDAGVWLDGRPPQPAVQAAARGDIREAAPEPNAELASGDARVTNIALWPGPGTPNGWQCWDLVSMQGVSRVRVKVGDIVCAKTRRRQAAVLRIEAIPRDYSGVTAAVTVWGGGPAG